jgi:hypothetical protein
MKKAIVILMLGMYANAHAGLLGLTHHSRANCGNNESISWDATKPHWLSVHSTHLDHKTSKGHEVEDKMRFTRRSAAVCWFEATSGYTVIGRHFTKDDDDGEVYMAKMEMVDDCSLYNGWWGIWEDIKNEK